MTPFRIDLVPSPAWRSAVVAVAVLSVALLLAWLATTPAAQAWPVRLAAGAAVVAAIAAAASLLRSTHAALAFDGKGWRLTRAECIEPQPGRIRVAVDLGSFLLLRFAPAAGGRSSWLPIGSGTVGHDWHALRAAVYSARSAAGSRDAGASLPR